MFITGGAVYSPAITDFTFMVKVGHMIIENYCTHSFINIFRIPRICL